MFLPNDKVLNNNFDVFDQTSFSLHNYIVLFRLENYSGLVLSAYGIFTMRYLYIVPCKNCIGIFNSLSLLRKLLEQCDN